MDNLIDSVAFTFMVVNKKTHELIDLLTLYGVSSRFGTLDVTALTSTKPRVATFRENTIMPEDAFTIGSSSSTTSSKKKKKKYAVSDRLAYDEVYDTIDGQLHLTFDYLALIAVGAIIAAIGLLTNSAVAVVASMLVSPLMGPIVGMTFGAIIREKQMFWKAFRNEAIGVFVCFVTGAVMGFITAPIMDTPLDEQLAFGINTQISSRGEWIALAWGAGIAAPSGVGVALGVSADQVSALIGVAISAALLPPITNSGCCLASAFVFYVDPRWNDNHVFKRWWHVGYISMLLFFLNWCLIFIFGVITFRIKKLHLSANEHAKMEKLNKFYEFRDKMQLEEESNASQSVLLKTTNSNGLKTPLLNSTTNGHGSLYAEDDAILNGSKRNLFEMSSGNIGKNGLESMESMDGVPTLLSAFSEDGVADADKVSAMMNWDKTPMRSTW